MKYLSQVHIVITRRLPNMHNKAKIFIVVHRGIYQLVGRLACFSWPARVLEVENCAAGPAGQTRSSDARRCQSIRAEPLTTSLIREGVVFRGPLRRVA